MGNFIRYLPPNVTQIVADNSYPDLCTSSFTLQPKNTPGDSCTLQLLISGVVNANDPNPAHHLFACFPGGKTCAGTLYPLNVEESIIAAAGVYVDQEAYSSDIQTTLDYGETWTQQRVPSITGYSSSLLAGVSSCSGAGEAFNSTGDNFSIVAVSTDNGKTWSQQLLTAPEGYQNGRLQGIFCSSAACWAVGDYTNSLSGYTQPVVTMTSNTGTTWSQQVLALPSGYTIGQMAGITCSGTTCIGVGYFQMELRLSTQVLSPVRMVARGIQTY